MANFSSLTDDLETILTKNAHSLVESLDRGDLAEAVRLIQVLRDAHDRALYLEVGRLTRELHNAINELKIDPEVVKNGETTQISDATDRLSYVVKMTEGAANRTMDLVEDSSPDVNYVGYEAQSLGDDWHRFHEGQMTDEEMQVFSGRMGDFLARCLQSSDKISANLSEIMLAQGFQDLTGQIIKRVTDLVTHVENSLLRLVLMASKVDRYAGIAHEDETVNARQESAPDTRGEGPQIHAEKRNDVVANQDDVDDLLSSLGF